MEKEKKEKHEATKNKRLLEKSPLDTESKRDESDDDVEEIFGVHVLGKKDTENHFGVSPVDDSADSSDQKTENQ